jgi:hypothetical protein
MKKVLKFTIDRRYIAIQILKVIVYYLIGVFIVLYFFKPKDQFGFVISSLFACTAIYLVLNFPRKISVSNEMISFSRVNCYDKTEVPISDIIEVEVDFNLYNTLTFHTKSGSIYRIHPHEIHSLQKILTQHQLKSSMD